MSFVTSSAYKTAMSANAPSIALVTGGKSGIGLAVASMLASLSFVDKVIAVSRSITQQDVEVYSDKFVPLAANVATEEGRNKIVSEVQRLCCAGGDKNDNRQLRFLVHAAGTIEPIKPIFELTADELKNAMTVNCEAPLLLTTALYPYMVPNNENGDIAGRVLHVSSGAAHGAPPVGWGAYGISKAAFFQSFRVLEREFRHAGGKVVVGSFKPGVVDTAMQGTIRSAPAESMPVVENFKHMKEKAETLSGNRRSKAAPPPSSALDRPENVAFFAEYLLVGTTDEEFANANDPNEFDIRDKELYPLWIPSENLPRGAE